MVFTPGWSSGYWTASCRISTFSSPLALARLTPGLSLPVTLSQGLPRSSICPFPPAWRIGESGSHASVRMPGMQPMNPSGATPMTVTVFRLISTGFPRIAGSAPKRVCQRS